MPEDERIDGRGVSRRSTPQSAVCCLGRPARTRSGAAPPPPMAPWASFCPGWPERPARRTSACG